MISVQKAFFGGLIFGGPYYWRKFCASKWVVLDNKNSFKQEDNSLILTLKVFGLLFGRDYYQRAFASEIWGGLFSGLFSAYFFHHILINMVHWFYILPSRQVSPQRALE